MPGPLHEWLRANLGPPHQRIVWPWQCRAPSPEHITAAVYLLTVAAYIVASINVLAVACAEVSDGLHLPSRTFDDENYAG